MSTGVTTGGSTSVMSHSNCELNKNPENVTATDLICSSDRLRSKEVVSGDLFAS